MPCDGNGLVAEGIETVREPGPHWLRLISANPDYTPITRRGRKSHEWSGYR